MNSAHVSTPDASQPLRLSEQIALWEGLLGEGEDLKRRRAEAQTVLNECDAQLVAVQQAGEMLKRVELVVYAAHTEGGPEADSSVVNPSGNRCAPGKVQYFQSSEPEQAAPLKQDWVTDHGEPPTGPDESTPVDDVPPPAEDSVPPAEDLEPEITPEPEPQVVPEEPAEDAPARDVSAPPPAPEALRLKAERPSRPAPAPERQDIPFRPAPEIAVHEDDRQSVLSILREHRRLMSQSMLLNRLRPWKMAHLRAVLASLYADNLVTSANGGQRWGVV